MYLFRSLRTGSALIATALLLIVLAIHASGCAVGETTAPPVPGMPEIPADHDLGLEFPSLHEGAYARAADE
jgi:hypothetical protein